MECEICDFPFDTDADPTGVVQARLPLFFTCCGGNPCLRCTTNFHNKQRDDAALSGRGLASASPHLQLTCPCCRADFIYDRRVHTYHGYALNRGMIKTLERTRALTSARSPSVGTESDRATTPASQSSSSSAARPASLSPLPPARPFAPPSRSIDLDTLRALSRQTVHMCSVCRSAPATSVCATCAQTKSANSTGLFCPAHSCTCSGQYLLSQQTARVNYLDQQCTGKISQLGACRAELTSELAGLRERANTLYSQMDQLYNIISAALRQLHEIMPRQLDHLVEERTKQIALALCQLDNLETLYTRIQLPLITAAATQRPVRVETHLEHSRRLFDSLDQLEHLVPLSTGQPPPPVNGGTAEDNLTGAEAMFAAFAHKYHREAAPVLVTLVAKLEDLTSKVPLTDVRMDEVIEGFDQAQSGQTIVSLRPAKAGPEPQPGQSAPEAPQPAVLATLESPQPGMPAVPTYTTTDHGHSVTQTGAVVTPLLPYETILSHPVSVPTTHALVSNVLPSRVALISYDAERKIILRHDLLDGKFVLSHLSGRISGADYEQGQCVHNSHSECDACHTFFITPPYIMCLQDSRTYVNFVHPERLYQVVELDVCHLVVGLTKQAIVVSALHPDPGAVHKFTPAYHLRPFTAERTVLVGYQHYLLLFWAHEYSVCDLRTYSPTSAPHKLPNIKLLATDDTMCGQVIASCVDSVHHRVYLLTTNHKITVYALHKQDGAIELEYDARTTINVSERIKVEVGRIHWVSACPTSLFFVDRANPNELHELISSADDNQQAGSAAR